MPSSHFNIIANVSMLTSKRESGLLEEMMGFLPRVHMTNEARAAVTLDLVVLREELVAMSEKEAVATTTLPTLSMLPLLPFL